MKKREGFVLNVYTCFTSEILCVFFVYICKNTRGEKNTEPWTGKLWFPKSTEVN